ncbi:MAG: radical SAM protein [Deltaproteobacteria bacterium]|nr:radical SAM protein [Deltaproteobacteria bacterium]
MSLPTALAGTRVVPWVPFRLGEQLGGGWWIDTLELSDRPRLELRRGLDSRLRMILRAEAPEAGAAAAVPVGDAWLEILPSALPPVAHALAIEALVARIVERAGEAGVRAWLGRLGQRSALRLDLGGGRRRAPGDLRDHLARLVAELQVRHEAGAVEVRIGADDLDAELWTAVRILSEGGADLIRISLRARTFLSRGRLKLDEDLLRLVDLEVVLEAGREGGSGLEGLDLRRLGGFLRKILEQEKRPRVVLCAEPVDARNPEQVMALAAAVAARQCEPLHLRLPEVPDGQGLDDFLPLLALGEASPRLLQTNVPAARVPAGALPAVVAPTWQDQARLLLTGRPEARLQLTEILPAEALPALPCVLPWVRLEHNSSGIYGPCCADYLAQYVEAPTGAEPETLWRGEYLQRIRRAVASPGHPETCSKDCPVLAGGTARPSSVILRGGPGAAVENQIATIEAMLEGKSEIETVPFELCLAVTSHCNYDCIMCCVNRQGPEDQLGPTFYAGLAGWLDRLLILDANGGEPLASSHFRDFLAGQSFEEVPQLRVHLTTNGSYFAPEVLERYLRVPFSALTVSLNAASAETYAAVNKGLAWERILASLEGLLRASREGRFAGSIRYSFVVLQQNLHELAAFARLAREHGVGVRFLLPTGNRNETSIMLDTARMEQARDLLREAVDRLHGGNAPQDRADIAGILKVIEARLASGELAPLGEDQG